MADACADALTLGKGDAAIHIMLEENGSGKTVGNPVEAEPDILRTNQNNEELMEADKKEAGYGSLIIDCLPWAEVYINSKKIGTTPLSNPISLKEGVHNLELMHPEMPDYKTEFTIESDEIRFIKVNLDTLHGYLNCNVFPWGKIYINDKFKTETPLTEPIKLIPGEYKLTIEHPDYSPFKKNITIEKKDTLVINQKFIK